MNGTQHFSPPGSQPGGFSFGSCWVSRADIRWPPSGQAMRRDHRRAIRSGAPSVGRVVALASPEQSGASAIHLDRRNGLTALRQVRGALPSLAAGRRAPRFPQTPRSCSCFASEPTHRALACEAMLYHRRSHMGERSENSTGYTLSDRVLRLGQ